MTETMSSARPAVLGVHAPRPHTGPATIEGLSPLTVQLPGGAAEPARLAVPAYAPTAGDEVLVTRDDTGVYWVIGVARDTPLVDLVLDESAIRRVHDRDGALLFEYDPAGHRAVLHVPSGDLSLQIDGRLDVEARDGVSIAGRDVKVEATGEVSLIGSFLRAAGRRAEVAVHEARLKASELESTTVRSRIVAEVIDTRAGRIVERARDSYREIERLAQTRAGRWRTSARKAAQLVGEGLLLKARETAKIKGERIHLA